MILYVVLCLCVIFVIVGYMCICRFVCLVIMLFVCVFVCVFVLMLLRQCVRDP